MGGLVCPKLFPVMTAYLRNMTLFKVSKMAKGGSDPSKAKGGSAPPKTKRAAVYCSNAFELVLYNGPADKAYIPYDVCVRLHTWVCAWLPGFKNTWALQNRTPNKMLGQHGHCIDRIFIEQLWLYSKVAGKELFPCGLHEYPFDDGWRKTIYEKADYPCLTAFLPPGVAAPVLLAGPVSKWTSQAWLEVQPTVAPRQRQRHVPRRVAQVRWGELPRLSPSAHALWCARIVSFLCFKRWLRPCLRAYVRNLCRAYGG